MLDVDLDENQNGGITLMFIMLIGLDESQTVNRLSLNYWRANPNEK